MTSVGKDVAKYYMVYIVPALWYLSSLVGGYGWLLLPGFIFAVLPVLEMMESVQHQLKQTEDFDPEAVRKDLKFSFVLWLWVIVELLVISEACEITSTVNLSLLEWIMMAVSTGIVMSFGINIAHELIHRSNIVEVSLGQLCLVLTCYGQFYLTHIYCHHKNVGLPSDTATAKKGQTVYNFVWHGIINGFHMACSIAEGFPGVNPMLLFNGSTCMYLAVTLWWFGLNSLMMILLASVVSVCILETVQYVEHYGLVRSPYSTVKYEHSWNADVAITNYLSINLQRHSHHHCDATRQYQSLSSIKSAPTLPTGYAGCIVMAWVPLWWFNVMNPLLDDVKDHMKKDA